MKATDSRHTPPQPRSGDEGARHDAEARAAEEGTRAGTTARVPEDEEAGQQTAMPGWLSAMTALGLRPWATMYTLGAVGVVLGIILLAWPGVTLLVLAVLFGCYLVVSGIVGMAEGFSDRNASTGMRVGYVVLGVLGVALGLFAIRRVDVTVLILAFLLSVFWVFRGIVDMSAGFAQNGIPGSGWLVFTGILNIVAGVLVLFWPGITLSILVIFAGAWLLVYGLLAIYGGYRLRKLARA